MKIPRNMFDPYNLLDEHELPTLTAETAIKQIQELADKTLPHMSWQYYEKRFKAISVPASIAADRLGNKTEGQE